MKFAEWVYRTAGIYGLLVLTPLIFIERLVSQTSPPAITHPEYYYGFAITGVAWQVAFLVISYDPQRFRTLMPITWLEKSWGLFAFVLYIENRISLQVLALGLIDLLFAAFFVSAYITTTKSRVRVIGDPDEPAKVFTDWREYVQSETLTVELVAGEPPAEAFVEKHEFEGKEIMIGIKRN